MGDFFTRGKLTEQWSFTVPVTNGANAGVVFDRELHGVIWAIKTEIDDVTGSPSVVYSEDGGLGQAILTVTGTTTTIKRPRAVANAVADGADIDGSSEAILLSNSKLKCAVSGGTGDGTVTVTFQMMV